MPPFLELFTNRKFHLLYKLFHYANNEGHDEVTCSSNRLYKLKPVVYHLNVYDVGHVFYGGRSKGTRLGIKPLHCMKPNLVMVYNFIIYVGQDIYYF
jgi:hypothetical protein